MIGCNDVFLDVLDRINFNENGYMSNDQFNRYSWMGQLSCIDWISGDVSNITPPIPYAAQKNRDYLSPFIVQYSVQVINGKITRPQNYYTWENAYLLGNYNADENDCDDEIIGENCNIPIQLLSGDEFFYRCNTFIEGLQPSFLKPIAKEIGDTFEFLPQDLGSITLEYVKYPQRSKRVVKLDTQYNEEVYDAENSIDFEWPEYARPLLVWFITDQFSNYTREQALKQFNTATGKTVRG